MNRTQRRAASRQGQQVSRHGDSAAGVSNSFSRARASHGAGRLDEAEALYREILAVDPTHADAHHLLGVLNCQLGRNEIAEGLLAKAIALKPSEAAYHGNLGNALRNLGRLDDAIAAHRRALAIKPDFADAHSNLGNALKDKGELTEAVRSYRRAIALNPDFVDALVNLSHALREQGELEEAIAHARRALAIRPESQLARVHLSAALTRQGRPEDAVASLREAVRRHPDSASAHFNLGNILNDRGDLDEAADAFARAAALEPDFFRAHNNLGVVRMARGQRALAIEAYRRALAIRPDYAEATNNLGGALREDGRLGEAEACYRKAARLKPDFAEAHGNLGTALYELGRLEEAFVAYREALRLKSKVVDLAGSCDPCDLIPDSKPESAGILSNLLMTLHYEPRIANARLIAAADRYGDIFDSPPRPAAFPNDRTPSRRLRIGYVSGDFRQHAVGFFLASILEARDKAKAEVFLYSNNVKVDDWTRRLRTACDHWREIAGLADGAAAHQIREDRIDILVDLSGHTARNRLPLFALRPAPVQASWLGYFGAIGLKTMDYLLLDRFAVPSGEELSYREAIVRLPDGRFCYTPPDYAPTPVDPPSLARGFVTFGSFNHVAKIGDAVVRLWAEVLQANVSSRLILKWKALDEEGVRSRLINAFSAYGVAPDRLELRGFSPHRTMLEQYGDIDVALDPFPFGGGLTSCEALWMGVPVVTWPGDRPASRQTSGFLENIGLRECIAASPTDYVACATALSSDCRRLTALRRELRGRMATSSLCDASRFARSLEAAFAEMWRCWRRYGPPRGFDVSHD
jgi:predicted O-linked N-acetylglucosamine transferase (SPINDLY family)